MGEIYGRKKFTSFFSYARSVVIVLGNTHPLKRFTTMQFVMAFNALRFFREKDFSPETDRRCTVANDSLRTLVYIGVVKRIRKGLYEYIGVNHSDSKKFNKRYLLMKDPRRYNKNEKEEERRIYI